MDARGVAGLGKNLIDSAFVHGLSDDGLVQFIITGRDAFHPDNTTGIGMPARGGNPMITDAELMAIVAYLRSRSRMSPVVSAAPVGEAVAQAGRESQVNAVFTSEPTVSSSPTQAAPVSNPGAVVPTATPSLPTLMPTVIPTLDPNFDPAAAYTWSFAGCHGLDGEGAGVAGPGLQIRLLIADALRAFLSQQQPPLDPAILFPHPVRGG